MVDDPAVTVDDLFRQVHCIPTSTAGRRRVTWVTRWRIVAALQVTEAVVVATIGGLWLCRLTAGQSGKTTPAVALLFGLALASGTHFTLRALGAYDLSDIMNAWRSCRAVASAWVISTGALFVLDLQPPSTGAVESGPLVGWVAGGVGLILVRLVAAQATSAVIHARWLTHDVAIIGTGREARRCAELLRADRGGAHVAGLVSLAASSSALSDQVLGPAQTTDLQRFIKTRQIKDVIISLSADEQAQLPNLIRFLLCLPVRVFLWPPSLGVNGGLVAGGVCRIGGVPLLLVGVPPLDGWHWVCKDIRDRALAACLLAFIAPVLLGIALVIKLTSPGPVLFRQEREGYNGNMFTILKFRTMQVTDVPHDALTLTARCDPRVSWIGKMLRKTSLDELPQLINVLRGDMWLVGPRPHSPLATAAGQRYADAVSGYMSRLRVKPGITGWAQVHGWRGPTDTLEQIRQRCSYDMYYIQHVSLWLDVQILLRSAVKGFVHENAY